LRAAVIVVAALAAAAGIGGLGGGAGAEDEPGVTVVAGPKWGEVEPGSSTPYSVVVRNGGRTDVEGEVLLVPQPEPAAEPGARPSTTTSSSTLTTVLAVGDRAVTGPAPRGQGASTEPPPWPTHSAQVSLAVGTEKTLTVMVIEAPFGYRVELVGRSGRMLASSPGVVPSGKKRVAVLLLSEVVGAEAKLEALPQLVAPGLDVFQLRSSRDFPDVALHLAGLDAVVVDDFDTATLNDAQHRALRDYVSLGGVLVVAGGASWSRTLGSLPAALVPLRASGSTVASLGPLADFAAATTAATATVTTGAVTAGRVVLAEPGGPALVVESEHGAGRVVQLTYDPLAEPLTSDEVLRGPAWDQALGRVGVGSRWGRVPFGPPPITVAEDQLWGHSLEARPWPGWPKKATGLLVLYAAVVGPGAFVLSRRRRPAVGRLLLLMAAVVTTAGCLIADGGRSKVSENSVEVKTQGADRTVLSTTYRGVFRLNGPDTVRSPSDAAVSTVFTTQPAFLAQSGDPRPPDEAGPQAPVARGPGGGTVLHGAEPPGVRLPAKPWELRTVQTLSITQDAPALDATLSLVRGSPRAPLRLTGAVTNLGRSPIHQIRAQIIEGEARLVDGLAPGETRRVDEPVIGFSSGSNLVPQQPEEVAMFAAGRLAFSGPGQVSLVGLTSPALTSARASSSREGGRISIAVTTVALEATDTIPYRSGGARLVSISPAPGGGKVAVSDLDVPPGVGPLSVRYRSDVSISGAPKPDRSSVEVYNWTTATWRTLPRTGVPIGTRPATFAETPLDPAEIADGLVRLRITNAPAGAQLLLTSDSEALSKAFS